MKDSVIKVLLVLFTATYYSSAFANGKGHGAHEHGVVQLKIAVEGTSLSIILQSPSESFYGFEHEAKTASEKKAQGSALDLLKNKLSELIVLDPALLCSWSNVKLDVVKEEEDDDGDKDEHHGEHREIRGEWTAACKKSPGGSLAAISFSKHFNRIGKMNIDILSDQKQSHHELKKGDGKVQL